MKKLFVAVLLFFTATVSSTEIPPLPEPMTNNAVASLVDADGESIWILSALGLGPGKTWNDTLSSAYLLKLGEKEWQKLPDVPGPAGRLASVAVAVRGKFLVFGGYTVAEDGSEVSIETVHQLDPLQPEWIERAPMPIAVDDTVAVVYRERYVYLVSGWHDLGNVNLVQVYDVETDSWVQATPFPGSPVFGHAGGIARNVIVICDGVRIRIKPEGNREFVMSSKCYRGDISPEEIRRIDWHSIPHHEGKARYRMAAGGFLSSVHFIGGSDNPYNYDGIGYNGQPSRAGKNRHVFNAEANSWVFEMERSHNPATMDHRGLIDITTDNFADGAFCVVGGMREKQDVTEEIACWSP